jgi:hypothetical protein
MNEPLPTTYENSRNVQATRDKSKGKAPIVYTHKPKNLPTLISSDLFCANIYGSTSSLLDSTITKIQEISESPISTQPAQFTDFLSSWAHPKPNPSNAENSSPKPFQLYPPLQPIKLPLDNPAQTFFNSSINLHPSSIEPKPIQITAQPFHPSHQLIESSNQFHTTTTSIKIPSSASPPTLNPYSRTYHKSPKSPAKLTHFHPYYTRSVNPTSPPSPTFTSPLPPAPSPPTSPDTPYFVNLLNFWDGASSSSFISHFSQICCSYWVFGATFTGT